MDQIWDITTKKFTSIRSSKVDTHKVESRKWPQLNQILDDTETLSGNKEIYSWLWNMIKITGAKTMQQEPQ
jgi:hypothetical protein